MRQENPPSLTPLQISRMEAAAGAAGELGRIELGNRLIGDYPAGSGECLRGLEILRDAAEGSHGPAAQWLLGAYYLQTPSLPDAFGQAARWLERAADAGVAPAIERLANMHLRGLGLSYDPARARALLRRLADTGFQAAAWDLGYLSSTLDGGETPAAAGFARACALGYPPAYFSLGLRFAAGAGVERDGAFARALLLRAADARFPEAAAAADELAPESEFGSPASQWYRRLKDNYDAAAPLRSRLIQDGITIDQTKAGLVPELEAHFASLGHSALALGSDGRLRVLPGGDRSLAARPTPWEWLSERPRVGVSRQFVSREERAFLMFKVGERLQRPEEYVADTESGKTESAFFDGRGRGLGALYADTMVRVLERRISEATDWRLDALEPCSVICYRPGEQYRPHVDYFGEQQLVENRERIRDEGGQRVVTFLVCLRAAEAGGETRYEEADLVVSYEPGVAVMHYNVTRDGEPDLSSVHTGMPVTAGEKWLFRTTLREHSRYRQVFRE